MDVTYRENGAELTPTDQRLVRDMLERACGQPLFKNPVLTWDFPKEEE